MPLIIALAQINPVVGDLSHNVELIRQQINQAHTAGAQLVVFPELALTGYPPEDLLLRQDFLQQTETALNTLADECPITAIVGFPQSVNSHCYNAAAVIRQGQIHAVYHKHCLPNDGVFDEKRYFTAGSEACVIDLQGVKLGLTICEDIWQPEPAIKARAAGAELLVNINASPYHVHKSQQRLHILQQRVRETSLPVVYVNLIGGQDDLVFDGASLAMNRAGQAVLQMPSAQSALHLVHFEGDLMAADDTVSTHPADVTIKPDIDLAELYANLVLALKDYLNKNRFKGALLGLSGGVDSALVLALAVDAMGAEQVRAIMLPTQFTSDISLEDAALIANHFNVEYDIVPIQNSVDTVTDAILPALNKTPTWDGDTTAENLQARLRGTMLMSLSNRTGKLLLATGNKSEYAVGYSTLYGDMCGGFAPIKDVSKTLVYALCRYRNRLQTQQIPERILTRAPSAELAHDQTDQDSLPPYDELDEIIHRYVELHQSIATIVEHGFDHAVVHDIVRKIHINEYKRRQAAPGPKVSIRAFGKERRMPITSGFDKG